MEPVGIFPIDTVPMIPLAPFIVVPHQAIPLCVPVIEPVFQTVRVMNGPRHLPENHFAQSAVRIDKAGTMEKFGSHMVHYTITPELRNLKCGDLTPKPYRFCTDP
jgi:hypothetical protein